MSAQHEPGSDPTRDDPADPVAWNMTKAVFAQAEAENPNNLALKKINDILEAASPMPNLLTHPETIHAGRHDIASAKAAFVPPVLTPTHVRILSCCDQAGPVPRINDELHANNCASRGTLTDAVSYLHNHQLVDYPFGERKGIVITEKGRLALKSVPVNIKKEILGKNYLSAD